MSLFSFALWILDPSLVLFFGASLPDCSFSLTLCIGVCASDKAGTSPILHGLVLYSGHPVQTEILGASTNSFPPQGGAGSCGFHLLTLCWAGVWGKPWQLLVQTTVSVLPHAARLCWPVRDSRLVRQMLVLWAVPERGSGQRDQLFTSLGGSWWLGFFIHWLCARLGRVCGSYQPKPPCPFFPRKLNCARPFRAPRLARQKPVLWGASLGEWGAGCVNQPLPSPGLSRELGGLFLIKRCCAGCRDSSQRVSWISLLALVSPVFALPGAGGFQLVSGFLRKRLCEFLLNWCVWGGEGGSRASYPTILLTSLSFQLEGPRLLFI